MCLLDKIGYRFFKVLGKFFIIFTPVIGSAQPSEFSVSFPERNRSGEKHDFIPPSRIIGDSKGIIIVQKSGARPISALEERNLSSKNHTTLLRAIRLVGKKVQPDNYDILQKFINIVQHHPNVYVRLEVITIFKQVKPTDVRVHRQMGNVVVSLDMPPVVRKEMALALGEIKPSDLRVQMQLSKALLQDPKPFVRKASAIALGEIRPEHPQIYSNLLQSYHKDRNSGVRTEVNKTLFNISSATCRQGFGE